LPFVCAVLLPAVTRIPLTYSLRHLAVRWKTTLVTALAFTLVVALLIVMLAFVNGLDALATASGHPGNVIVLSQGTTDELLSYLSFTDVGDVGLQAGVLRDEHGRPLSSREIYTVVSQPGGSRPGERPGHHLLQIRGVEDPEIAARLHGLKLYAGGCWFSPAGVQELPAAQPVLEAVLGEGAARDLGVGVGDVFVAGPRRWLVVGIMESAGSAFSSEIWARRQIVGQIFGMENACTSIVMRTADADRARAMARDLTTRFKKAALWAMPETAYYAKMAEMNGQFQVASYLVALFMALGGACGLMNTMFAAVRQRRCDLAVLRVLGYTRPQILVSFLLESLMIALLGGLVGCAVGFAANGWMAASTVEGNQGIGKEVVLRLVVDGRTVTAGLLFTVVMGGLGGLLPAWSATRLRPLESLR